MESTSLLEQDSVSVGKPIVYRSVVDVPWGSLWVMVLIAGLYVAALGVLVWRSGQAVMFDGLTIVFAVGMVLQVVQYGVNLIQRRRFCDAVEKAEVLVEVEVVTPRWNWNRLLLGFVRLGLLALMGAVLIYFQRRQVRIPAFWLFYPPFLLVSIGMSLMSARAERVALTAQGLVARNWLFRTFFPWEGFHDVIVESKGRLLRIQSRDLPGWETIRLGVMPEEELEGFVRRLEQFVTVRKS